MNICKNICPSLNLPPLLFPTLSIRMWKTVQVQHLPRIYHFLYALLLTYRINDTKRRQSRKNILWASIYKRIGSTFLIHFSPGNALYYRLAYLNVLTNKWNWDAKPLYCPAVGSSWKILRSRLQRKVFAKTNLHILYITVTNANIIWLKAFKMIISDGFHKKYVCYSTTAVEKYNHYN